MKIGRYEIRGLLGRGGMGAVYKAAMPVTDRMVALKVCRPAEIMQDIVGMQESLRLFLREAVTMARIRHPNVAAVFDVDEAGGEPFFAMEYYCNNLGVVLGENYEVEKPSRRLPVDVALSYARQMLSALRRLHFEGIVHRDLKPFNVMLADWGECDEVKLIDFGLSRLRHEVRPTHKGMVVGSPYYTAPEQEADADSADARADLYSIGVTLYRMLTGILPDENRKKMQHVSKLNPDLDSKFDEFLDAALALKAADRFQSAQSMIAALDELARHWVSQKESVCSFLDSLADDGPRPPCSRRSLRRAGAKVSLKRALTFFGLDDLWRPASPCENAFNDNADGTVTDQATGLTWEKGGSEYPLSFDQALEYPVGLNQKRFAGHADWRLPTVDELASLFRTHSQPGEFCIEPVFDPSKRRLWSCDSKSFISAWYADAETGFIWWQDMTCGFHVRAVRG